MRRVTRAVRIVPGLGQPVARRVRPPIGIWLTKVSTAPHVARVLRVNMSLSLRIRVGGNQTPSVTTVTRAAQRV